MRELERIFRLAQRIKFLAYIAHILAKHTTMPISPEVQQAIQNINDAITTETSEVQQAVQSLAEQIRSGSLSDSAEITAQLDQIAQRVGGFSDLVKDPQAGTDPNA